MPLSAALGIAPVNPSWLALPLKGANDTCATLHLWTQAAGAHSGRAAT
jgi:hypothetical protein